MELNTLNGKVLVTHSHNHTLRRARRDVERIGKTLLVDYQGVVSGCHEILGNSCKYAFRIMLNQGGFTVHKRWSIRHRTTKHLTDGLMS